MSDDGQGDGVASGDSSDEAANGGSSDEAGASRAERLLMAASAAFTILLFAFVVWQAGTTPPTAEPTASVTGIEELPNGDVRVAVTLRNEQNLGLVAATVAVDCDAPAPELTFEHVPADDRRVGYVRCPPGTERPTATVTTWIET